MAELYTVNYTINVKSQQAINALNSFQTATSKLTQAGNKLKTFERQINKTVAQFNKLSKKTPLLDFSTSKANQKLDVIIRKLEKINRLAKQNRTITVNTAASTGKTSTGTGGAFVGGRQKSSGAISRAVRPARGGNYSYKVLGPAMIDTGGVGAIDMLKGMGIAYGITGLGTLLSSAIKDAVEYDNLMQTTRNILETHDPDKGSFKTRFKNMEDLARYIGISTKFTAPEVADMTKFLAMAGLDINAINHAMQPVANVALIGDTDLGKTADLITNIMTGYNIAPERIRWASDVMTMTFTSANTTLTEIAEAYKYSASLLSAANVPFEEATAALGVLGNAGVKGSQGGTVLRTILANILNPRSKKRADAWDAVGVKRFNEDGSMRSLSDIFQDLHDLNLDPTMYYRMFDRTAAQGAVALAAHVDTWNQIIERNFLSADVAQKLADKKKNTIQGLWYQMTSTFTERSMQVFEGMDSPIRQFLIEIRHWLNSDDFRELLKALGEMLMSLMKMFVDFTKVLVKLYQAFGPMLHCWLKLQLILSAILIPLRIFKSLWNFSAFVISGARALGATVLQFTKFHSVITNLTAMRGKLSQFWHTALPTNNGTLGTPGLIRTNNAIAAYNPYGVAVPHRGQTYGGVVPGAGVSMGKSLAIGAGSMGGMAIGSYLGSKIGEPGSIWNMLGIAGGALLGGWAGGFLPALFTNPVGWGILAVGAITGIVAAIHSVNEGLEKGHASAKAWIEDFNNLSLSTMDLLKPLGLMNAMMRISTFGGMNSDNAENDKNRLREETMHRWYLNNKDGSDPLPDNNAVYVDLGTSSQFKADLRIADQIKGKQAAFLPRIQALPFITQKSEDNGTTYKALGRRFLHVGDTWYENDGVEAALFFEGYNPASPIQQKFRQLMNAYILGIGNSADIESVISDIHTQLLGKSHAYNHFASVEAVQEATYGEILKSAEFAAGATYGFKLTRGEYQPWLNLIKQYDTDGKVSNEDVQKVLNRFIVAGTWDLFNHEKYGLFGSEEFNTKAKDVVANYTKYGYSSQDEAITVIQKAFTDLLDLYNVINEKYKPLLASYLYRNNWLSFLASGLPAGGISPGSQDGQEMMVGNVKYTWSKGTDGVYRWVDANGKVYAPSNAKTANQNLLGSDAEGDVGGVNAGVNPSPQQYQQKYNSNTATPKQVIVRIENLMNVESIDMSNPDNVAVINNFKGQMAQALIDAVHDFDNTYL